MIRREDKGPVFYRGLRVGLHGRDFRIFKFRSMVIDAEKIGASSTSDDDARITKIGKILRKYKIDELPQLLNVLKSLNERATSSMVTSFSYFIDIIFYHPGFIQYITIYNYFLQYDLDSASEAGFHRTDRILSNLSAKGFCRPELPRLLL